jgi:hypothetical protein
MVKICHKQNHSGSLVKFDHKMRYENANKIEHPSTYLATYLKTIYTKSGDWFFLSFLLVMMKKKSSKITLI